MLIVVGITLTIWYGAWTRLFIPARDHWRLAQKDATDRLGNRLEAVIRALAGILFAYMGLYLLTEVLSSDQIVVLLFGGACLLTARWLRRHYREQRALWRRNAPQGRLSEGGHALEVFGYLVGIPVLVFLAFFVPVYSL